VPYCTTYKYYCNVDSNNNPWNANTGCSGDCTSVGEGCDCVWGGCNGTIASTVMWGLQECVACAPGFVLYDGYCYVGKLVPASCMWPLLHLAVIAVKTPSTRSPSTLCSGSASVSSSLSLCVIAFRPHLFCASFTQLIPQATCYTIGTVDPGANTALYRTGRPKTN
jgi:hypothetical protein